MFVLILSVCRLSPAADLFYITNAGFAAKQISLLGSRLESARTNATNDYLELIRMYVGATAVQKAQALVQQTNFSPFLVFQVRLVGIGDLFRSNNLPKTGAFLWRVQRDTDRVTDAVKVAFHRPRPIPEIASFYNEHQTNGFPSGHAVRGVVFSSIVAQMFPEHSEAILSEGAEVGWNRVRILMHYPTDIRSGFELGTNILAEMKRDRQFAADLAESKGEIDSYFATIKKAINLHEKHLKSEGLEGK